MHIYKNIHLNKTLLAETLIHNFPFYLKGGRQIFKLSIIPRTKYCTSISPDSKFHIWVFAELCNHGTGWPVSTSVHTGNDPVPNSSAVLIPGQAVLPPALIHVT